MPEWNTLFSLGGWLAGIAALWQALIARRRGLTDEQQSVRNRLNELEAKHGELFESNGKLYLENSDLRRMNADLRDELDITKRQLIQFQEDRTAERLRYQQLEIHVQAQDRRIIDCHRLIAALEETRQQGQQVAAAVEEVKASVQELKLPANGAALTTAVEDNTVATREDTAARREGNGHE